MDAKRSGKADHAAQYGGKEASSPVRQAQRSKRPEDPDALRERYRRQRPRRHHCFFRRFMGHGKLARYSQGQILYITDFINRYPRKKFNGKSSEEVFEELKKKKQNPANPNNNETCN